MKIAKEPISMETPIGDDEDSHLGDFIEDTNVESPIENTTNINLSETVRDVLAGLTPREAKVLRMRFGIDMNTDHTLEEVGKQFDVTRERIRQIEAKALAQAASSEPLGAAAQFPRHRVSARKSPHRSPAQRGAFLFAGGQAGRSRSRRFRFRVASAIIQRRAHSSMVRAEDS